MRIGLFATCVADTMFPEAARATMTVLERLGHEVVVPGEQTCCDQSLTPAELDELDGAITACTVAIAETGTIALTAGPHEGRRLLSLMPDLHICVADGNQVVGTVPEASPGLPRLSAQTVAP